MLYILTQGISLSFGVIGTAINLVLGRVNFVSNFSTADLIKFLAYLMMYIWKCCDPSR